MDTDLPPSEPVAIDLDETPETAAVPAVVAVVVALDDAPRLEACLGSLADSDYPDLTVLVIAATDTELTPRVALVFPTAFVRPTESRGIAACANEAIATVAGAPFFLFCHTDVVVEPSAVRLLVEEAYRSNAAIVGPKLVDVDRSEILREVGWSIDRLGVPHSEIERDELDQEQHDAVRDVFFVSDACMLVRADLFNALQGFDVESDPGARALDLCWRARLASARVIVAPDARVGHHEQDGTHEADPKLGQRHRVRALLTNTSAVRLLWIAPVAFALHLGEALVFLVRRRRDRAGVLMGAWTWNLRHLAGVRGARRRSQGARAVPDREINSLQFRGSARVSHYMTTSLHAEDRVQAISRRGRSVAESATTQFRTWRGALMIGLVVLALFGARGLVFGRLAAVGQFAPWPGFGDLVRAYTSEWRFVDLGSHAPAPPLFAVLAGLRVIGLGAGDLMRTLVTVAAIPFAVFGTAKVGRRIAGAGWPSAVAAATYGIIPIPRNAIAAGRLGPLVVYVVAPWIFLAVVQLGGLVPNAWPQRRIAILGGVAVALTASVWPLAALLPVVMGLGLGLVAPVTRDSAARMAALARGALTMSGIGVVLLFPWPVSFFEQGDRTGALGIVFEPTGGVGALLRFVTGPNGGGIGAWAFVAVGLAMTLIAGGEREAWCVRLWGVAALAWILTALPAWLGTASPSVDAMLVPAALAMALIAGLGAATFLGDIRKSGLGWSHVTAFASAAVLAVALIGFVGDSAGGRWHQPDNDWNSALSWMRAHRDGGGFRVLWIGAPDAIPGTVHRAGSTAFGFTTDGPGDIRDSIAPPGGAGEAAAHDAVRRLRNLETTRFGRLVGPMAVRYVALPLRPAPGVVAEPRDSNDLAVALSRQLDLRQLEVAPGMVLYENTAWIPERAVVTPAPPARSTESASVAVIGAPSRRPSTAPTSSTSLPATQGSDTVLWSQQYSPGWHAPRSGISSPEHRRAFGWANAFTPARAVSASASIRFVDQWWRWPLLTVQFLIVTGLARRAARRGRRRRSRRAEPATTEGES